MSTYDLKSVVVPLLTSLRFDPNLFFFPTGTFTIFEGPTRRRILYQLKQLLIGI